MAWLLLILYGGMWFAFYIVPPLCGLMAFAVVANLAVDVRRLQEADQQRDEHFRAIIAEMKRQLADRVAQLMIEARADARETMIGGDSAIN